MSGPLINPVILLTLSLFIVAIFAICHPQAASAEPIFLLKSEQIKKTVEDTNKVSTLGFDDKGNLTVRKGKLSVVLIYNPLGSENEALANKAPVLTAMNHENPEITGIGVKINFAF